MAELESSLAAIPGGGPNNETLLELLRAPMRAAPDSLAGQLAWVRGNWGLLIGSHLRKLLGGVDLLAEEDKPVFYGPGPSQVLTFDKADSEYEAFSQDKDWMPRVVMIAKSTLVWLDQLSKQYGRAINSLDAIPDQELDLMASRGFNALWLIGLWERSDASRRIKELCGNPEAAASAYALHDYEIAGELGGWGALENLRHRALSRGIRLAADMVPNHTGIDSDWVRQRPQLFIQRDRPPFPGYSYSGENLSRDPAIGLWLEDHYYSRSDAAVVFKRVHFASGHTTYIYHGNDGTSMPWNDTAQIDFLNPEARAAVIERILHVARNFPIIRFDAAMIMAKRHFRRLWYPEPGHGGDIASRSESALSRHDFDAAMPQEFWREVVDACARETPDCLLLAEAFWMMEGYFVRTLGMHRVYNSAFMNMLRQKENKKYRDTIKNTQEFDKDILKRFVNFMNNPDEETAVNQFGKDDHYIGVCSLMATLPGLPMFGHGQVEGFTEKYGMEYRRAYRDEQPDHGLVTRHEREIFPLLKRRYLFSGVDNFALFDVYRTDGSVDENIFAFVNGAGSERALVLFNNAWERSSGTIHQSSPWAVKHEDGSRSQTNTTIAAALRLAGGPGRYLAMQEQRTGLWYLRSSDFVHSGGLYVELDGFRTQVFLHIHEAVDSDGSWTQLHDNLQGQGVPDIQAALQDIRHAALYRQFNAVFGAAYMALAHDDQRQADPQFASRLETLLASLMDLATASASANLLASAGTTLPTAPDTAAAAAGRSWREGCAQLAEGLPAVLATIDDLQDLAEQAGLAATAQNLGEAGAKAPNDDLAEICAAQPQLGYCLLANLAIKHLRLIPDAARQFRDLGLDRKLRENIAALGTTPEEANRLVEAAWLAAELADRPGAAPSATPTAGASPTAAWHEIIDLARETPAGRWLFGVNLWDGTTWFNRERFDFGLGLAAGLYAGRLPVDGLASSPSSARLLAEANRSFVAPLRAKALAAGWNLDKLLANLPR
ncbi:MAG TPA: hypothetical protein DCX65_04540 [Spirochaetaceae bacterium]|nr:hypothetical protein [Spirochaetaceae bacterium]